MCNSRYLFRHYSSYVRTKCFSDLLKTKEQMPKGHLEAPTQCKSIKLMLQNGILASSCHGVFNLMPLAVIALEKLITLIDVLMKDIGGQKVILPALTLSSLWKKSGRWNNPNAQLFKLKDRHDVEYCLGPTHEEVATSILVDHSRSFKHFPLLIYQITSKFRDEIKPRLGLLRGREFIMKDMYSFDISEDQAKDTYSLVNKAYDKLFQTLKVEYAKVEGSNAGMGGNLSQEYHFLSDIGEDEIFFCSKCKTGYNAELINKDDKCSSCNSPFLKKNGIEVGHTFYLGTTYSEPFNAKFKNQEGKLSVLEMGCYGLGVSRIIAASIECLSSSECIRWPEIIAPFYISIIPPKKGSKEEIATSFSHYLYQSLSDLSYFSNNIIYDDRTQFTIGKRVQEANTLGIHYSIVSGGSVLQDVPKIEVIDNFKNETVWMTHKELMQFFRDINDQCILKLNNLYVEN